MGKFNTVDQVFLSAVRIPLKNSSKFVLMSDCHRGNGTLADDFSKTEMIYYAALQNYDRKKFTYIELGDGDELWENKKMADIVNAHKDVFQLLDKFYQERRLYLIYGNHDIEKRNMVYPKKYSAQYEHWCVPEKKSFLEELTFHEGIILEDADNQQQILLLHGHQVDFFNHQLWRFSRLLVRYIWKNLEMIGIVNPTSPATNQGRKKFVAKKLASWADLNGHMIIAGHNHRPALLTPDEGRYFNTGCCVFPQAITAIEIEEKSITLVKWGVKARGDGTLFVAREVLEGPEKIASYSFILEAKAEKMNKGGNTL